MRTERQTDIQAYRHSGTQTCNLSTSNHAIMHKPTYAASLSNSSLPDSRGKNGEIRGVDPSQVLCSRGATLPCNGKPPNFSTKEFFKSLAPKRGYLKGGSNNEITGKSLLGHAPLLRLPFSGPLILREFLLRGTGVNNSDNLSASINVNVCSTCQCKLSNVHINVERPDIYRNIPNMFIGMLSVYINVQGILRASQDFDMFLRDMRGSSSDNCGDLRRLSCSPVRDQEVLRRFAETTNPHKNCADKCEILARDISFTCKDNKRVM